MSKRTKTAQEHWEESKAKTVAQAKLEGRVLKSWQVIYETVDRWCLKGDAVAKEKVNLMLGNEAIKIEIRDAARAVADGTHEQINASSQAKFLISVALGKHISDSGRIFEKAATLKDGSTESVTKIAAEQRLRTKEFMTAPVAAGSIKNVSKKLEDDEEDLFVMTGHVGAMHFNEEGTKASTSDQVVSKAGSSSGKAGVHVAQLEAQRKSSHQITLSRRLSKVMDEFQEDGTAILEAFDKEGFHENSNWQGIRIKTAEDALAVAIKARHHFKKRQTKEKEIREPYVDPTSASEHYSEIATESETRTEGFSDFADRTLIEVDKFEEFADRHKIDVNSKAFEAKLKKVEAALSKDEGRI